MKYKLPLGVLLVCALLHSIARSTATNHTSGNASATSSAAPLSGTGSKNVAGDGCIRAGVEKGCLILTTADKKNKYSLHFDSNNKPSADTMIHFEGTTSDLDTCMQGTPVKVTKWNALKTNCPAESK
jgi:hypothetical protein